jgi:NTP pyrophosphatase (non-canonical NTP hydrolase)
VESLVTTVDDLTVKAARFAEERDWAQFHTPKDLALGLTLEAAELAELMQWKHGDKLQQHLTARREALEDELADVLWYVLLLAHYQGIDLTGAFERKLAKNAAKYPVEKSRGSAAKYTELRRE